MKIVQLMPGAGENFYCENCLRDAASLRALRQAGQDALALPMYLPLLGELAGDDAREEIFFGGINVYLQQKLRLFRHTPRWLDRLLDAPWLLRLAGRQSSMTDARVLGETTLSMLRGERGRQVKELDRLASHLARQRPDVILLSNALLIGVARRLGETSGGAVVCWLQDEEGFLDNLPEPYRRACWQELQDRIDDVRLVAPSHAYARRMAERLDVPEADIRIVRQGVDVKPTPQRSGEDGPPTVGFLSQLSRAKGLDLLIEAVARLRRQPAFAELRLRAVGGQTRADQPFLADLRQRIDALDLAQAVTLETNFDPHAKQAMLGAVDLLAVPTRQPDAYALYMLEALAASVPVVVPDHGGPAELLAATGGGLCHQPGDVEDIARAIAELLAEPDRRHQLAATGQQAVEKHFSLAGEAEQLLAACREATGDAV